MKILKRSIGVKYELTCFGCGSILEATQEDIKKSYTGCATYEIICPVCDDTNYFAYNDFEKKIIYEGEEES